MCSCLVVAGVQQHCTSVGCSRSWTQRMASHAWQMLSFVGAKALHACHVLLWVGQLVLRCLPLLLQSCCRRQQRVFQGSCCSASGCSSGMCWPPSAASNCTAQYLTADCDSSTKHSQRSAHVTLSSILGDARIICLDADRCCLRGLCATACFITLKLHVTSTRGMVCCYKLCSCIKMLMSASIAAASSTCLQPDRQPSLHRQDATRHRGEAAIQVGAVIAGSPHHYNTSLLQIACRMVVAMESVAI